MSRDGRKPWEIPVQYVDDRWEQPRKAENIAANIVSRGPSDNGEERSERDIEEILRRPDRPAPDDRDYECNDTTPINYNRGPHDEEFGVDDHDFDDTAENPPLNYDQGPHDEEFGIEDEEDFEPLDVTPEFDDEV